MFTKALLRQTKACVFVHACMCKLVYPPHEILLYRRWSLCSPACAVFVQTD